MNDEELASLLVKRAPGGLESLTKRIAPWWKAPGMFNWTAPRTCSRASCCMKR